MRQHFSEEQANAILRKAIERQPLGDEMSRQQLEAVASELGISPAALAEAEAAWEAEQQETGLRTAFDAERRSTFWPHLTAFLIVNVFLLFINLLTSPGFLWVLFPVLGWGMGLAFHAVETFRSGPEVEKEYRRWLAEQGDAALPGRPGAGSHVAPGRRRIRT